MATSSVNVNKDLKSECLLNIFNTDDSGRIVVSLVPNSDKKLSLCATDGVEVWRYAVEIQQSSALLNSIRKSISQCQVSLLPNSCRLSTTDQSTNQIDLLLTHVSTDGDRSSLIQQIMFGLADSVRSLEQNCSTLQDKLNSAVQAKHTSARTIFDAGIDSKKKKSAATKAAPKQIGMSVVNPGTKKRSAPKGVEFD